MTNRIGQQLGNYRLLRLLGRGNFAEVYLSEHIHLESQAAIKVLRSVLQDEHKDSFLMEARRLVRLKHPHIVRFLEFGFEGGIPFLIMEYAPNGSLRTQHPTGSQIPLETIVSYVKQVAEALQYLHEQGLVHRDVKPENMLLGSNQEVMLSDLGIAAVAHASASIIGIAGTPAYMAPEQIRKTARPASDQYALGVVVYEWLCGNWPFHGSVALMLNQHLHALPPPLREKIPTISPAVEDVVLRALAKDSEQRFAHVRAFATALEQASRRKQFPSLPSSLQAPSSSQSLLSSPEIVLLSDPVRRRGEATPLPSGDQRATTVILPYQSFQRSRISRVQQSLEPTDRRIARRKLVLGFGLAGLALITAGTARAIWWLSQPDILPPHVTTRVRYTGHSNWVGGVAWSPDGRYIASGGGDKTVQVWHAYSGRRIYTYSGHKYEVAKVAWSPDSRHVASASYDNTVQVWDALTGGLLHTYRGHSSWVVAVAWSPDGTRIASASWDKTAQIWNATTGQTIYTYQDHTDKLQSVAWSPNGTLIVSAGNDLWVRVWYANTGKTVSIYKGHHTDIILSVAWSPDGKHIASAGLDNTVYVWELTTGKTISTYGEHHAPVTQTAWSPDGIHIASASWDKTVQIWNATTGQTVYTYRDHTAALESLTWSPYGTDIASAGKDKIVRVWQISFYIPWIP